jgi:hypothetical protein
MQDNLSDIAIQAALTHNWEQAITTNKMILEESEDDISALSRLAFAYIQIGKIKEAKRIYHKILALDRYNTIAHKNLEKINSLPKQFKVNPNGCKTNGLSPNLFLEEPGRTKTIILTNIAPSSIVSKLSIGDTVTLYPKKHSIEVRDSRKTYLGALPDDVSFRLLRLIKAGNGYHVCIKNVTKNSISVFVKETKRGKKFASQPSFITLSEHPTTTRKSTKHKTVDDLADEEKENHEEEE